MQPKFYSWEIHLANLQFIPLVLNAIKKPQLIIFLTCFVGHTDKDRLVGQDQLLQSHSHCEPWEAEPLVCIWMPVRHQKIPLFSGGVYEKEQSWFHLPQAGWHDSPWWNPLTRMDQGQHAAGVLKGHHFNGIDEKRDNFTRLQLPLLSFWVHLSKVKHVLCI